MKSQQLVRTKRLASVSVDVFATAWKGGRGTKGRGEAGGDVCRPSLVARRESICQFSASVWESGRRHERVPLGDGLLQLGQQWRHGLGARGRAGGCQRRRRRAQAARAQTRGRRSVDPFDPFY